MNAEKLYFASDYMEGAHPALLNRLIETNMAHSVGYGQDEYSEAAREKVRRACGAPEAEVTFLVGGTQTNATVIDALLRPWQGIIAANTGHIAVHEAGAIEFGGHKVLAVHHQNGKLTALQVERKIEAWRQDANREHMVMPGMVYISHPSEYGTLYSLRELQALSDVCRKAGIPLFLDGARLAYALACPENDVTLPDIARLCDAFYIGGTKCGALFGEAVVFPQKDTAPHFFTIVKQHGALLAKGRIAGVQFDALFTDDLYFKIGLPAIEAANQIRRALSQKGYELIYPNDTNQVFFVLDNDRIAELSARVEMGYMEAAGEGRSVMRLCTSWATARSDVDALIALL